MTNDKWEHQVRQLVGVGAAIVGSIFAAAVVIATLIGAYNGFWKPTTMTHIPTIIGLPFAALASLLLVLVLRTVSGNIEVKLLGFEFKGAAGPLIMWILCFLAITLAITKTWNLTQQYDSSHPGSTITGHPMS